MTASNFGAQTQTWQAKWVVFIKSRGLSGSVSFLSSPSPSCSFTCAIFHVVFDSRSSFFARIKTAQKRWLRRLISKRFATLWHSVSMYSDHNGSKWVGRRMGNNWPWSENSKVRIGSHSSKSSATLIQFFRIQLKKNDNIWWLNEME